MKITSLAVIGVTLALAGSSDAQQITTFENLDFEAGVQNFPSGFDNPAADVPGWRNYTAITDSGTEGPGAWWGTYNGGFSAFMKGNEGAYNLSDYTIQAGDAFSVDFVAKSWPWVDDGAGQWTVSLFYDDPANVFGSYTTPALGDNSTWVPYSSGPIASSPAAQGGKLGIIFLSSGGDITQVDGISVNIVPEPTVFSLLAVAGAGMLLQRRRAAKA